MSDWNGKWTCHHELVKNILSHLGEFFFNKDSCTVFGSTETKIQEKCCPLFQRYLPMVMFISPGMIQSMFIYLFSSPELYLYIHYSGIENHNFQQGCNLSFVLATVTKICELTMHLRGLFLFYYSNCLQYLFHFFLWDNEHCSVYGTEITCTYKWLMYIKWNHFINGDVGASYF